DPSYPETADRTRRERLEGTRAPRLREDLRVLLGPRERLECRGNAVDPDSAGQERRRAEAAVGARRERRRELVRRVAEDELEGELLVRREDRLEAVGLHAHSDDDDARLPRRAFEDLL